jgi:hypothetical protein
MFLSFGTKLINLESKWNYVGMYAKATAKRPQVLQYKSICAFLLLHKDL